MNAQNWSAQAFSLDYGDIALWNALMSQADQPIQASVKQAFFSFRPADQAPKSGRCRKISFGEDRSLYLHVVDFPFFALCGVELEVEDLGTMAEPLADALLEGMHWTLVNALPNFMAERVSLGRSVFVDRLTPENSASALRWFSCTLSGLCDQPIQFSVGAKPDDICSILNTGPLSARKLHAQVRDQITSPVLRLAGSARVPIRDVKALEPGDVILFSEHARQIDRTLLANGHLYTFEQADQDWRCLSITPFNRDEDMGPDAEFAPEEADTPPETDTEAAEGMAPISPVLQTSISFCLGSAHIPLSELETWQIGAAVPLPPEVSAENTQVTLRANGLVIAEGDLVRIDDRLAARLTKILLSGA